MQEDGDVPEDEPDVVVEDHDVSSSQAKRSEALRRAYANQRRASQEFEGTSTLKYASSFFGDRGIDSAETEAVADSDIEGPDAHDGTDTSAGEAKQWSLPRPLQKNAKGLKHRMMRGLNRQRCPWT